MVGHQVTSPPLDLQCRPLKTPMAVDCNYSEPPRPMPPSEPVYVPPQKLVQYTCPAPQAPGFVVSEVRPYHWTGHWKPYQRRSKST